MGDFFIDPWRPVRRAVVTHAHADHARAGSQTYLCAQDGKMLLQSRLGHEAKIQILKYGEVLTINGINLSLHPAGHILGSAQVKIERVSIRMNDILPYANLAVSWGLFILIWLVQLIIYPGFHRIPRESFATYHKWYVIRMSCVVLPS